LPGIPSEREVEAEGRLNMTELQLKLLEKIEELTLYTLEQEKQLSKHQQRLSQKDAQLQHQQKILEDQQRRIERLEQRLETSAR
jgi:hypothetical protein